MQTGSEQATAAALERKARQQIDGGCEWLTAPELVGRAGGDLPLAQWLAERRIFCVLRDGQQRFPCYLFVSDGTPLAGAQAVLRILQDWDGEQLAAWFESTSSFLGGGRPRELIAIEPGRIADAARNALDGKYIG